MFPVLLRIVMSTSKIQHMVLFEFPDRGKFQRFANKYTSVIEYVIFPHVCEKLAEIRISKITHLFT
jgi:hypothetical protein